MEYEESTPPSFTQKAPNIVTLADIDEQNRQPHEEARAAVDAAFGAVPYSPSDPTQPAPAPVGPSPAAPVLPPLPDFSTLPPLPPLSATPAPLQDAGGLPPEKLEDMFAAPQQAPQQPQSNDPKQFKIPGQP
jgi:hypothetical protein